MAEGVGGVSPFGVGVYPKSHVLNRFIAKFIDLLLVAAADQVVPPVGFLAGFAYVLVADGFAGGRSIGKRLIGLQTIVPRTRETAGFKDSIIRNLPFAAAQLAFEIPWVGWIVSSVIIAFEALLILGNDQGRRLGDAVAQTQVIDTGHLDLPD
ncbi:MAG: RDD family protein [Nitrospiraceae bacterium]